MRRMHRLHYGEWQTGACDVVAGTADSRTLKKEAGEEGCAQPHIHDCDTKTRVENLLHCQLETHTSISTTNNNSRNNDSPCLGHCAHDMPLCRTIPRTQRSMLVQCLLLTPCFRRTRSRKQQHSAEGSVTRYHGQPRHL